MVMHKAAVPYPTNPPSQPDYPTHNIDEHANLVPDSTDIPPITRSPRATDSSFYDSHNPWSHVSTEELRSDRPLPEILRPGPARQPDDNGPSSAQYQMSNVPNILRAGQSQEETPRSSLDSDRSKGFWEESDDEEEGKKSPKKSAPASAEIQANNEAWVNVEPPERSPGIKRKPVAGPAPSSLKPDMGTAPGFASNNPFRRPSQTAPFDDELYGANWGQSTTSSAKGKEPARGDLQPPTDHLQGLKLGSSRVPDMSPDTQQEPETPAERWQSEKQIVQPPMPQAPPPPPPSEPFSPFSHQPPLIPVASEQNRMDNPWASDLSLATSTASPIPFAPSQKQVSNYNEDLLDRGQQSGVVSLKEELETLPNAVTAGPISHDEPSLLEDDSELRPALPNRPAQNHDTEYFEPPEGPPPPKPPRPSIRMTIPSDEDVSRMIEQRNETYQIKHFNWFDHSSRKLRRSSMLTQNQNGPCPLLALVNALILGAQKESQAVLDEALRSREQVTLGLIIETLMDELLSRGYESVGESLPDVDELNSFLMRLRTGMNANPRFVPLSTPPPNLMDLDDTMLNMPQRERARQKLGTFESTPDMKLYGAFSVPLVHGWLPEPASNAEKAFARSAQTYEDAQALQFGEEELEYKLTRQGLTPTEQNMWEDINAVKNFLKNYPTQLTPTGLETVRNSIASGTFAIMFRNDHFSTIYKHPESGQLLTLITDAGYADRDEIIWESLVDISGTHNEFFSGDFMPVSNHEGVDQSSTHPASRRTSQLLTVNNAGDTMALSPQEQQEQHDADFAMALQLQEEEEQRQRAERNRRRSSANNNNNNNNTTPRRSTGNIPIPLRSQPEVRPAIPPRNSHAPNPGVNRPVDPADEAPPPTYDEAAKGRPYIPPLGSPLHPSAGPSPMNSNTQLTGTTSNTSTTSGMEQPHPPGPNAGIGGRRQPGRRLSAYNETTSYYGPQRPGMPGGYMSQGVGGGGPGPSRQANMQGRDRDCIVM
ncbi:hypothetical protein LTR92_003511 [Exophiala xenobiotica]|nr:hypothetical protein LTR92_003511 [Exophiala xenobiotica]KAK5560371.1 hypothetical protein LTR46_002121 [Exophiala xenobiotica]